MKTNHILKRFGLWLLPFLFPVAATAAHNYVDLGLPSGTLWADCNVGANSPEGYGNFYAWGETKTKTTYSWSNYQYASGSASTVQDLGDHIAGTMYDAAKAAWGDNWVMPTNEQANELINKCDISITKVNNVKGLQFKGPNGKTVFFPFSGYKEDGSYNAEGTQAYFWTDTKDLYTHIPEKAMAIFISSSKIKTTPAERHFGYNVRAVKTDGGGTDPLIAPAESPKMVDLGLSVKWCSQNVGASWESEYGPYFAWGETSPKSTYTWANYQHASGTASTVKDIGSDIQGTQYDAAYMRNDYVYDDDIGDIVSVCLPTKAQWEELRTKCTWKEGTEYGHKGYLVTGPNGNTIFLPFSGSSYDGSLHNVDAYAYYWTSEVYNSNTQQANAFLIKPSTAPSISVAQRRTGLNIRAVEYNIIEEEEPYAVLNGTTLTFYYDDQKASRSGTKYSLNTGSNKPGWNAKASSITKVVFNPSFADAYPTSTYYWFAQMSKLTSITGLDYLMTEDVTNMAYMFYGCSQLKDLDLSTFNTNWVTDMSYMFSGCTSLSDLTLYNESWALEYIEYNSTFVTKAATNLSNMFAGCSSLKDLVLVEFTVKSSTNTTDMFKGCTALSSLYINTNLNALNASALSGVGTASNPCFLEFHNWDAMPQPSSIKPTYYVWKGGYFYNQQIGYAELSSDGKTLTFCYDIFDDLSWTGDPIDIYPLNTGSGKPGWLDHSSGVTKVVFEERFKYVRPTSCYQWFNGMASLKTITGLNYLITTEVTNMTSMFSGCKGLTSLDLSGFTIPSSNTSYMMKSCSGLKTLTVPSTANKLNSNACTEVGTQSAPCTLVYPSGFDLVKEATGSGWFKWKNGFFKDNSTTTDSEPYAVLSGSTLTFYYDNQKSSRSGTIYGISGAEWFDNARSITKVVFNSSFANARPTNCNEWFCQMDNLTSITGISYLNTSNVTDMYAMFAGCSSLTTLDVSKFNTANVTDMSYMFAGCSSLTSLNLKSFNTAKVTDMEGMFTGCSKISTLDLSSFNTAKVVSMGHGSIEYIINDLIEIEGIGEGMFEGCSKLTSLDLSNFNTSSVYDMSRMFCDCSSLTTLKVSSFNTSNVILMRFMFTDCSKLTSLDISNFVIPDPIDYQGSGEVWASQCMLSGCTGLKTLSIPSTAYKLNSDACTEVGTKSAPCTLVYPSGFTPQTDETGNGWYKWKGGYFKSGSQPSQYPMGDVNHDGFVSVVDATLVVDYVLGNNPPVFYRENANMNHDSDITVADYSAIVELVLNGTSPTPTDNHEYVDLGLPSGTLWATCNVGASSPEGYGKFFAWGETKTKTTYSWSNYQYASGSASTVQDLGDYIAGTNYDAAMAEWGSNWVMPTNEQANELINKCDISITKVNNVKGLQVKGPNGKTIFFPFTGYKEDGSYNAEGTQAYFWTDTKDLYTHMPEKAMGIYISTSKIKTTPTLRHYGSVIRAVRKK